MTAFIEDYVNCGEADRQILMNRIDSGETIRFRTKDGKTRLRGIMLARLDMLRRDKDSRVKGLYICGALSNEGGMCINV